MEISLCGKLFFIKPACPSSFNANTSEKPVNTFFNLRREGTLPERICAKKTANEDLKLNLIK